MHKCGNSLDLIFTEARSSITIRSCIQGPYISDHCITNCPTTIPAEEVKKETITFRKFKNFDPEKFFRDINLKVNPDTTIDNIVNDINQQITMVLYEHVPLVTKTITTHYINPWLDKELREQKRTVQSRERVWKKYKSTPSLAGPQQKISWYHYMVKGKKKHLY